MGIFIYFRNGIIVKEQISHEEELSVRLLLNSCIKIGLDQVITDGAIKMRKKYGLKLPDAIIPATPQYLTVPLLTAD